MGHKYASNRHSGRRKSPDDVRRAYNSLLQECQGVDKMVDSQYGIRELVHMFRNGLVYALDQRAFCSLAQAILNYDPRVTEISSLDHHLLLAYILSGLIYKARRRNEYSKLYPPLLSKKDKLINSLIRLRLFELTVRPYNNGKKGHYSFNSLGGAIIFPLRAVDFDQREAVRTAARN